jgi:hypothetical protein
MLDAPTCRNTGSNRRSLVRASIGEPIVIRSATSFSTSSTKAQNFIALRISFAARYRVFYASWKRSNLKSTIESLATEFAMSVIDALRAASIDELTGVSVRRGNGHLPAEGGGRRARRLGRRTTADIGRMLDSIVTILEKSPEGLRAEQIRAALSVQAKELPRPLADGLTLGRLTKSGQKRATTYFAAGIAKPARTRGGRKKRAS